MIRTPWRWFWGASIRRQLIVGVALVHMLLMTFFVLDLVHRQQQFLLDRATKRVLFQTEVLATSSLHQVITQDLAGLAETLASLSRDRTIRYAMVTDRRGRVLGHTEAGKAGGYLQDATSRAVMKQEPRVKLVHTGVRTITATAPVMVQGRPMGWAWVASDLSADRAHLQYVTHAGLIYTLVAILIGTLFAVLLAGAITRPLQLLLQGTEQIAHDRLDAPIPITTDNEVGTVTRAFNAAMEKLAAQRGHLRASEERYRLLVDSVKDYAIILLDRGGQVVSWNTGAERIKGYRAEEILGEHFSIFYATDDRAAGTPERALQEALAHGRLEDQGWRCRSDGSRFWADVIITAVYGPAGELQGFAKITRDLTERRQAEEEIRLLNQDLERRVDDRTRELEVINQELNSFSYSVSHDLRAPLRSIDGFSQALLEDCADQLDADGQRYLQRIRSSTQRIGQLIDDLLDLSRLSRSELRRETVDLSVLAAAVADDLRHRDPERQVEFVIAAEVTAKGDRRLLQVGIENLLGNAWKYTGKRSQARIEFGVTGSDGETVYFVRDNGAGFDMAYADKLFGAFQRLHGASEFPGTGIGLATVQRIMQRHGGRAWAEAAVDQGATFFFTLQQEGPDSGAALPMMARVVEPTLCRR